VWYAAHSTKVTIKLLPPLTTINSPSSSSLNQLGNNHFRLDKNSIWIL
jgi:hypothetical protein